MRRSALACLFATVAVLVSADAEIAVTSHTTLEALQAHIQEKNPDLDPFYLRTLYRHYETVSSIEGISLTVALAQMVHETDYLRFSGVVRAIQYNYAGIGATDSETAGARFADMRTGVIAHVQHLKAYANTSDLRLPLEDPRFALVTRGSAPSVLGLTGRWATDPAYGQKILAHIDALREIDGE